MKTKSITGVVIAVALGAFVLGGCSRKTRGYADTEENRAAAPAEGGGTLTKGGAGDAKNFGDTRATTEAQGKSPSASPTGLSRDTKPENAVETPGAGASTGPTAKPEPKK